MTKRDQKSLIQGLAIGAGLFGLVFFFRRRVEVPVLAPTQVKWENE